ncbi:hypothetical protein KY336_00935 [Candidatus Woesearchaeota archaeon]|nr:hypothetical protein [Candidatus Woesearchaeota archaeon]
MPGRLEKLTLIAGKFFLLTHNIEVDATRIGRELILHSKSPEFFDDEPAPEVSNAFFALEREVPHLLEEEDLRKDPNYKLINGYVTRRDSFYKRVRFPSATEIIDGVRVPQTINYHLYVQFVYFTPKPEKEQRIERDEEILGDD